MSVKIVAQVNVDNMRYREVPKCLKCGKPIKGIYRKIPIGTVFCGDTFIKWDWEGHKCNLIIKIFKNIIK